MSSVRLISLGVILWWRRLIAMTRKEMLQLSRDLPIGLLLVYSFTLAVYIAGNGIRSQLHNASLLVQDNDHSVSSRELIHKFRAPYFRLEGEITDPQEGLRSLDRGRAMAVLEIPPRFHEQLMTGEPTAVQFLVDTTNAPQGLSAASYAVRIVAQFEQETVRARLGGTEMSSQNLPVLVSEHRVWYNPDQDDAWFESISHLLRQITIFAILLPAAALVREKERGTVEQLLVSPLTPFQIMLPKVLAMTVVILCATAVALFGIMRPAFGVPIRGSITRNQAQVGMLTLLIVAPMMLLSGLVAPMEALPPWTRHLMMLSPLRYFIDIANGILLKGSDVSTLWEPVLAMVVLGGGLFGFGMWRFRRQFD
jgi:ABC-2 type transport system permease protein